jgi:defect-in-organelle-trafficking protein DotB
MSSLWPDDQGTLTGEGLDKLLVWASQPGVSRIALQSERPPVIRQHGRNRPVLERSLSDSEVGMVLDRLYASAAVAQVKQGRAIDVAYMIKPNRDLRLRFRVNGTGVEGPSTSGINIVMRPISDMPVPLEEQNVEQGILDNYNPDNGMIIVGGKTGSGKTTLIGGMNRARLEDPHGHYDIVEGAAPIELLYDRVERGSSTIAQLEIPRDLPDFQEFIRACMRQEPTDIVVGECRDPNTMEAAVQAAISGHRLTTTIHTFDASSTIRRIVSLCPASQREALLVSTAESLRLIVNQRLLPSIDGRRTPIREFIAFDRTLRMRLLDAPAARWPAMTHAALATHGQSFAQAIAAAHREGRISGVVAAKALKEEG